MASGRARQRRLADHQPLVATCTREVGFPTKPAIAPLAVLQGAALGIAVPGYAVRPALERAGCNALHLKLHGYERGRELLGASGRGPQPWSSTAAASQATLPRLASSAMPLRSAKRMRCIRLRASARVRLAR
jgi:hypothetical protein